MLLLGPEAYERRRLKRRCSRSRSRRRRGQHDLRGRALAEVLDDARALSLFAAERLIWVVNAEAALPRGRSEEEDEGESGGPRFRCRARWPPT